MEMSQSDPGTSAPQPSTSGAPPPNTVQAPTPVSAQGPPQPQQLTPQQQQDNNYRQRLMEQLQRMSPKDKYAKVAPHARCFFVSSDNQRCQCIGFRDGRHINQVPPPANINPEECFQCRHPEKQHGNLVSIKVEELDKLVGLVMQLEQYALNAGVVNQDPAKRARSLESATKLKTLLHQFFEKSFEKHADPGPPFEKPNIVHILMMFLDLKFPRGSAHRPIAETVTQQLVHEINIFELQSPASNRTPIHPTPGYQALFRRWELMVKANAQIKEAKYRTSDVFGKFILRSLVRDIQNHFTNNLYATDPQGLSFVTSYFGELEKELSNDKSPILMVPAPHPALQVPPTAPANSTSATPMATDPASDPSRKRKADVLEGSPKKQAVSKTDEVASVLQDGSSKARDEKARREEALGVLTSRVIQNDKTEQNMKWLTTVKNIFSKQLPKMPKEYIVRLVFDRNHRSLIMQKQEAIVGSITFRPFRDQGFAEIAFCAIISSEQVKGYGTHLMNHLKVQAARLGIYTFLTYADNFAIGYFKKQGFTKTVSLDQKKWLGYIKDYDGGTLMECVIHPKLDHLRIPEMVAQQRKAIYDKIKEISFSHVKHKGLAFTENGTIDVAQIPGLKETGWKPPVAASDEMTKLTQSLTELLQRIKDHPSAWPFVEPVDPNEVPTYYEIIKDPIDLKTIEHRLSRGNYYITREIFLADLQRMVENCKKFNPETTEYYQCGVDIENLLKRATQLPRKATTKSDKPEKIDPSST